MCYVILDCMQNIVWTKATRSGGMPIGGILVGGWKR